MCVSPCVLVATVTTHTTRSCAHYIGALLASVPASVSLSSLCTKLCRFSPLRLCTSAPLRLCASVLLSSQCCSGLTTALVSHLLSSLLCTSLCSALLSALFVSLLCSWFRLCLCSAPVYTSSLPFTRRLRPSTYGLLIL